MQAQSCLLCLRPVPVSMAALLWRAWANAVPDVGDKPTRPWTAGVKGVLVAGGASPAPADPPRLPGDDLSLGRLDDGLAAGVDEPERPAKILSRDSLRDAFAACRLAGPRLVFPATC